MGFQVGWLGRVSILSFLSCYLAAAPDVFEDYFDSDVKIVDISQKIAFKACMSEPGPLIVKTNTATRKCLGGDNTFDWNDFSDMNNGPDPNNNGLSNSMENAELCFYKEMGWLDGNQVLKSQILDDFSSLDSNVKADFVSSINDCTNWSGDFASSRRKRSVDEEDNSEFSLLYNIRQKRQAHPVKKMVKKTPSKNSKKKLPPPGGIQTGAKTHRSGSAKGRPNGGGKGKLPGGKGRPKGKGGSNGGGKGKQPGPVINRRQENPAYTKLWCVDLAIQRSLKSCVENVLDQA